MFQRIGFLVAIVLLTSSFSASPQGNGTQSSGRYQLFQGEYRFIDKTAQLSWNRGLFKIDTATGEVWIATEVQSIDSSGKIVQKRYWEEFEYGTSAKKDD